MKEDSDGYLHPEINYGKCVECRMCMKVCPELNLIPKHKKTDRPIALVNKDKDILMKSTSGGMFSLMSDYILKNNGKVYGVKMDKDFNVYHTFARNNADLAGMRGSKYVQSSTGETYRMVKEDLKSGIMVLYTGTPCQVAGLLNYLGKTDRTMLYTADIVCHGTPSGKMFRTYISKLAASKGVMPEDISDFRFRELDRWGLLPSCSIKGKKMFLTYEDNVYMKLFLSSRINRECCYSCRYATQERVSDITIADFWEIGRKRPFGHDTDKGCSMVLTNTDKGKELFGNISQSAFYDYRDWEEAMYDNHQLYRPSHRPDDREKAIEMLFCSSLKETFDFFVNTPLLRLRRTAADMLRFLKIKKS